MGRLIVALIELALIFWSVFATVGYFSLKRRMAGLHEPELWLPRRERRAHARKLLAREDDEYVQQLIAKNTNFIQGEPPK